MAIRFLVEAEIPHHMEMRLKETDGWTLTGNVLVLSKEGQLFVEHKGVLAIWYQHISRIVNPEWKRYLKILDGQFGVR